MWAAGYLLLFQFYKVVVGRVIAAAYMHSSLKVGVAKSSYCCIAAPLLSLVSLFAWLLLRQSCLFAVL